MTELFRWEGETVDIGARDLPGLKGRFLVDHVPHDGVVLDVGCGGGKMLRTLATHRPDAQLFGCDIRQPGDVGSDFEFRLVDADDGRLPFADSSIGIALVIDVLEHVTNPSEVLAEIARVVEPGGLLVSFVPVEGESFSFYRAFRALLGQDLYVETKDHLQAFRHADVEALVGAHFDIEERRYAYHFFGHLMDAGFCALLRVPVVKRLFWNESPYHSSHRRRSITSRVFAAALIGANRVAWAESRALGNVKATSAGVLLSARRR